MSPFLPLFIIFLIVLAYFLRKNTRLENETKDKFWKTEREANTIRKQDISNLPYITIPLDTFPLGKYEDSELAHLEQQLSALSCKSILNLNGITNTELKLTYGIANLDFLSECDENYTEMIRLLQEYGQRLFDTSHSGEAAYILQYAIDCGSDICATYMLLSDIYLAEGNGDRIPALISRANELNSARKQTICDKLNEKLPS